MQALPTHGIRWHLDTGLPSLQKWRNTFLFLEASPSVIRCESCPNRLRLERNRLNLSRWRHSLRLSARMHTARLPASHGICGGASLGSLFLALQQFMPSYFLPVRTAQAFIHIWGSSLHLAQSLSLREKPVVRGEIANPQRLWLPLQVGSETRPVLTSV